MSVTLHTSCGDVKLELFCELAPKASKNFLGLCASGFYDGTVFHRNVPDFMIQGGKASKSAPKAARKLRSIYGDYFEDELTDSVRFDKRGLLAMANKGPHTNNTQFFLSYKPLASLDGTCTIFGRVIAHSATLAKMEACAARAQTVVFNTVTIHANPFAERELWFGDDDAVEAAVDGEESRRKDTTTDLKLKLQSEKELAATKSDDIS